LKEITIEDLMIPFNEYSRVSEDASLIEAIEALKNAQKKTNETMVPHRALLVYDKNDLIVGKISQIDILKALEYNSAKLVKLKNIAKYGFSQKAIQSLIGEHNLWESLLAKLDKIAAITKVKDIMQTPSEGEFVDNRAPLNEAIHQLATGRHQSLLVVSKNKILGILRLAEVFNVIYDMTQTL
jgi:CBS domain containing-hemolysin-like protein